MLNWAVSAMANYGPIKYPSRRCLCAQFDAVLRTLGHSQLEMLLGVYKTCVAAGTLKDL
jgi:hypothetical protein